MYFSEEKLLYLEQAPELTSDEVYEAIGNIRPLLNEISTLRATLKIHREMEDDYCNEIVRLMNKCGEPVRPSQGNDSQQPASGQGEK